MSKYLKRSQLAKALGIHNASITQAIKNGTLISEIDGSVDIDKPGNQLWIDKQETKGNTLDLNRIYDKPKPILAKAISTQVPQSEPEPKTNDSKKNTLEELRRVELQQKKATLQKTKKDIKLADLKIQKLEGELIPYESAKTVFLYAIETWKNTYKQEARSLANIYVNRLGAKHKHFIELQKELNQFIEQVNKQAIKASIDGLDGIVDEFKEVRGKGEHVTK